MKFCGKCKLSKPLDAFAKHAGHKDGLQTACRACFAEHYTPTAVRKPAAEAPMAQVLAVIARLAAKATPEAVAERQVFAESATCARGHAKVLGNIYVRPSGRSECRACR